MTSGRAFVGTSGWAYASWKPLFYPEGTKSAGFLAYYATRLATLEVNYTFNHLPTEKNIAGWKEATPEGFVFALKASQQITHVRQLREPAETVPLFFERARPLGERLGPVLFQTPPWLKRDDDRLAGFLATLPRDQRSALEVRDPSWYVEDVYELLRTARVALVHAEGERAPSPRRGPRRPRGARAAPRRRPGRARGHARAGACGVVGRGSAGVDAAVLFAQALRVGGR